MTIELDGTESGTATLTDVDGVQTRIVIELGRARQGTFLAHIHEESCDRRNPQPVNVLSPVRNGRSETVAVVTLEHLRSVPHAIDVHRTMNVVAKPIACGTVGEGAGLPGR